MTSALELSIVVAVKDAEANLPRFLEALGRLSSECELLLCFAGPAPTLPAKLEAQVIAATDDMLIPQLWRDGIIAARGRRVALTTAQCIPASDWLQRSRNADIGRWAGIGGAIANDPNATLANWAIFFLRYSAFAHEVKGGVTGEIAADNAIYDRAAVLACRDLLEEGFWEPNFHRRFHEAGRELWLDPGLLVTHYGVASPRAFARQRLAHGYEYGLERGSRATSPVRLVLLFRSPVLPLLIVARVLRRMTARPAYRRHLLPSLPWLLVFACAWGLGEATGYAAALAKAPPFNAIFRRGRKDQ